MKLGGTSSAAGVQREKQLLQIGNLEQLHQEVTLELATKDAEVGRQSG